MDKIHDGEINIGQLSEMQILAFCEKMGEKGFSLQCETYDWIPYDYTETHIIMINEDENRTLYLFCLLDDTWVLCSEPTQVYPFSKVKEYA